MLIEWIWQSSVKFLNGKVDESIRIHPKTKCVILSIQLMGRSMVNNPFIGQDFANGKGNCWMASFIAVQDHQTCAKKEGGYPL